MDKPLHKPKCEAVCDMLCLRDLFCDAQIIGGAQQIDLHLLFGKAIAQQSKQPLLLCNRLRVFAQHTSEVVLVPHSDYSSVNAQGLENRFLRRGIED